MSMEQYVKFSQPHLQFFCHKCSFKVEGYNYLSALSRIYNCVPDLQRMHAKAESEQNLLQFYNVTLPVVQHLRDTVVPVHTESVLMLRDHAPWLLDSFQPADVGGDRQRCVIFYCNFNTILVLLMRQELKVNTKVIAGTGANVAYIILQLKFYHHSGPSHSESQFQFQVLTLQVQVKSLAFESKSSPRPQ